LDSRLRRPQAFFQNGDGHSDSWSIPDLVSSPVAEIHTYNHWSHLIYQSKGEYTGWDGAYF